MQRPVVWAMVAMANLSAMTLFLWHQTAFLTVTMAGLLIGRLSGLHTAPSAAVWVAERIAWLPAFAAVLAILWMIFRRIEQRPRSRRRGPAACVAPPAQRRSGPGRAVSGAGLALVAVGGRWRGLEGQRAGVDAIALAGRSGPVAEDVTQMTAAATADHLGPPQEPAVVRPQFDRCCAAAGS